ncbi:MAG: hypothetical protein A2W03_08770 [Candidatus Aminicenantes bacterium RBG_16_63_16]|nr:MAG: hypothetical protein A2W03_08770 [Candidatus Aminicenantes bacterium RBG_16_63_16]
MRTPIGEAGQDKPWIADLCAVDLDQDGLKDVLICDAKLNEVRWLRQDPLDVYTEKPIGPAIMAPAHVAAGDLDKDGDLDVLVAAMGMVFPNNDKIGSVVVLENDGRAGFAARVLVDRIARVTDVEPGDLDGDGDIDLAVGQFGYDDGEIRWLENTGGWSFKSHILLSLSGTIHTPVVDIDSDGDLDIVAIVSQEWEELYVFENDGRGAFQTHLVWGSSNEDFGSSGIRVADIDRDGDLDIFHTNGDAFDYIPPAPRPWHGVQWFENQGNFRFAYHRVADLPGAYGPGVADLDGDGDLDLVAVSTFNNWASAEAYSLVWYENDGQLRFTPRNVANNPTHLLTVFAADMDGDGRTDLVTGGFYAYPPYDRQSRILLWRNTLGRK